MTRLSSLLFLVALAAYYLPVLFKCKKPVFGKIHVYSGIASLVTMIISFVMAIGTEGLFRYLGFSLIILIIVVTGFFVKRKNPIYRRLHITSTIGFFVYLIGIIIF